MSIDVDGIPVLYRQSFWENFMGVAPLACLGDKISKKTSSDSYNLPIPSSVMIPEIWVQELCYRFISWD